MLALVTMALLGAGDYSVVVARRLGVDAKRGAELSAAFASAIEKADKNHPLGKLVPVAEAAKLLEKAGFPDPSVCNGSAACVSSLSRVSGFSRLVALQLVKSGSDLAVDASVVEGEKTLTSITRSVKNKSAADEFENLARDLLAKLPKEKVAEVTPPIPPPVTDTPKNVDLEPPPPLPPPEVVAQPAPGLTTGRKVALGLGGGAVVGLGVGIALGTSALSQSKALNALDPQFETKAAAARGTALGADVSYIAAGSLAVGALIVWLVSGPSSTP